MLRHQVTLTSPLPVPAARTALLTWLQRIGYRLTSPPFLSSISASRGAFTQSLFVPDPSNWTTAFSANFTKLEDGCEIELEWNINTIFQIGLVPDIEFWKYEIWRTMGVVLGASNDPREYAREAKKARTGNSWRLVALTIISLVTWVFVGYESDSILLGTIAFLIVLIGLAFAFKAPRDLDIEKPPERPVTPPPMASIPIPPITVVAPPVVPTVSDTSPIPPPIQAP